MSHPEDDTLHENRLPIPVEGVDVAPGALSGAEHSILRAKWKTLKELAGADWRSWFATPPPRRQWLLERRRRDYNDVGERTEGVLPLGKVAMLAAGGGMGKTMALVQLALAVATGREWLDTFATPNPGPVLIALGEEDEDEFRKRLFDAAQVMRLTDEQAELAADRIVIIALSGTPVALTESDGRGNVKETPFLAELRSQLETGKDWRLVILDPLSRFAGNDTEKDNAVATRFIQAVETLLSAPGGPTVLLAHHTTKTSRTSDSSSDATAARGASGLTDGVRWVANLDQLKDDSELVELKVTKSNYSRKGDPVVLVREWGGALRAERRDEQERRRARAETHGASARRANAKKRDESVDRSENRYPV